MEKRPDVSKYHDVFGQQELANMIMSNWIGARQHYKLERQRQRQIIYQAQVIRRMTIVNNPYTHEVVWLGVWGRNAGHGNDWRFWNDGYCWPHWNGREWREHPGLHARNWNSDYY